MPTDHHPTSGSLSLSENDVLKLLEDKTPNVLIDITEKIAGAYGNSNHKSNDSLATEQIFRLLLRETELKIRVSLANHVKSSTIIPRDIVMSLARDVEEVALPILQYSEVLDDNDLIELIDNTQEITRHLAVSRREHVSDVVSDTLLSKNNEEVASVLISNAGAAISNKGLHTILERYTGNEHILQAVSNRPHLPLAVTEKLITVVSSTLAATLKKKYNLPGQDIEQEVEKTREGETLNLVRISRSQDDVNKLVAQLHSFDRLSPSIILSALCQGNFCFFETSLAKLSSIPVNNARTLINDKGELGFRAIYNKSGLPDAMFPAVRLLLKVVKELDDEDQQPGTPRYANRVVERILQYSETDPVENLSYIIALVRRIAQ